MLDELCPQSCSPGNGVCEVLCLTRGCNWDGGDCSSVFVGAGVDAARTCPRTGPGACSVIAQTNAALSGGCYDNCFIASCDWSRNLCGDIKTALATCPLFDIATFASFASAAASETTAPVYAFGGGPDGQGRCANSSQCSSQPGETSEASLNSLSDALSLSKQWVYIPPLPNSSDVSAIVNGGIGATLDAWLRLDSTAPSSSAQRVLSSPTVDLSVVPTDAGVLLAVRLTGKVGDSCHEGWYDPWGGKNGWALFGLVLSGQLKLYVNGTLLAAITGGNCSNWASTG